MIRDVQYDIVVYPGPLVEPLPDEAEVFLFGGRQLHVLECRMAEVLRNKLLVRLASHLFN